MPRDRYSRGSLARSKTKPQKWTGQWFVYVRQPCGAEKRVHKGPVVLGKCSDTSKSEAQEKLDKLINDSRRAADQKPADEPTFGWLLRQHIELKTPTWSDATAESMAWIATNRLQPALGALKASEVTRVTLQTFLNDLAASGASQSLVEKSRLLIKTVCGDAVEDDLMRKDPSRKVEMPRILHQKCSRFHTEDECAMLLGACYGRDHLILRLFIVCGFRSQELFALRRGDVEPGRIRIDETVSRDGGSIQPTTKTAGSRGFVAMPALLEMEMRAYLEGLPDAPDRFLFASEKSGVPIRPKNWLRRNLKAIATSANVNGVTFQSLRRTTATHAQSFGTVKDVQAMMRHATAHTTVGVYMQELPEGAKNATEALDAKLCKPLVGVQ